MELGFLKRGMKKGFRISRQTASRNLKKSFSYFKGKAPKFLIIKTPIFIGTFLFALIIILFIFSFKNLTPYFTYQKPDFGGTYTEGVVGKINQLNPLFVKGGETNGDIGSLIFSGLTKLDGNRKPMPDIASFWKVSQGGTVYTFYLKPNIFWQDGQLLTADDVVFTFEKIQDPDTQSPFYSLWNDVKVERVDKNIVRFTLPNPYSPFLTLTSQGIVPKHILENIPSSNLAVTKFNTQPVGTGPFRFQFLKETKQNQELDLEANPMFYPQKPYLEKVIFKTYQSEDELWNAYVKKEIDGVGGISPEKIQDLKNINYFEFFLPRYIALFFNQKNAVLKDQEIRKALSLAVDKDGIVKDVSGSIKVSGPLPPGYLGHKSYKDKPNLKKAKEILEFLGWKLGKEGAREKSGKKLKLTLVAPESKELQKVAFTIKSQLEQLGILIDLKVIPSQNFSSDYLRPRNYDLLLFGQSLGPDPDVFNFWHSTQKDDPGLNFSYFDDKAVDNYLESGRSTSNLKERIENYQKFQDTLKEKIPAVFLYNPVYVYITPAGIRNIKIPKMVDSSNRFYNINEWYIEEKAVPY